MKRTRDITNIYNFAEVVTNHLPYLERIDLITQYATRYQTQQIHWPHLTTSLELEHQIHLCTEISQLKRFREFSRDKQRLLWNLWCLTRWPDSTLRRAVRDTQGYIKYRVDELLAYPEQEPADQMQQIFLARSCSENVQDTWNGDCVHVR